MLAVSRLMIATITKENAAVQHLHKCNWHKFSHRLCLDITDLSRCSRTFLCHANAKNCTALILGIFGHLRSSEYGNSAAAHLSDTISVRFLTTYVQPGIFRPVIFVRWHWHDPQRCVELWGQKEPGTILLVRIFHNICNEFSTYKWLSGRLYWLPARSEGYSST